MGLYQIIYSSQPFGYDEATLGNLLVNARQNNARDDITGALICRRDIFLQLLEGPEAAVLATLTRIQKDDRHLNVTQHLSGPLRERLFGQWAMLHDPAHSWIWPANAIEDGVPLVAGRDEITGVFAKLASNVGAAAAP